MRKLLSKAYSYLPIIGLVLLCVLLYRLDYSILVHQIHSLNLPLLTLSILPLLLSHILLISKWWLAHLSFGYRLKPQLAIKSHFVGLFYGTLSPANAASVMKGEMVYQHSPIRKSKIFAITTLDKAVDVTSIVIMAIIGLWWWQWFLPKSTILFLLVIILLASLALTVLYIFSNYVKKIILKVIKRIMPQGLFSKLGLAIQSQQFVHNKKLVILTFIIGCCGLVTSYLFAYMVAKGLGLEIDPLMAISSISLVALLGLLPISISGLGTREWGLTLFWQTQGILPELTVATSLLVFLVHKCFPAFLGAFIALNKKKKHLN